MTFEEAKAQLVGLLDDDGSLSCSSWNPRISNQSGFNINAWLTIDELEAIVVYINHVNAEAK
jgi:hypothetical protein